MKIFFVTLIILLIFLQKSDGEEKELEDNFNFTELREALLNDAENEDSELKEYTQNWLKKSPKEYLLIWLESSDFDIEKTKNIIKKSLKWRMRNKIENVFSWRLSDYIENSFKYLTVTNSSGPSMLYARYGEWNLREAVQLGERENFIKAVFRILEETVKFPQTLSQNGTYHGYVFLADLEGFSLRDVTSLRVLSMLGSLTLVYQNNYPLHFGKVFFMNAPSYFSFVVEIFKRVLNSKVFESITVTTDYPKDQIGAIFSPENLPKILGGNIEF